MFPIILPKNTTTSPITLGEKSGSINSKNKKRGIPARVPQIAINKIINIMYLRPESAGNQELNKTPEIELFKSENSFFCYSVRIPDSSNLDIALNSFSNWSCSSLFIINLSHFMLLKNRPSLLK